MSAPRENLASRTKEAWRPPTYASGGDRRSRLGFAARRFIDLQAGSIWRDLAELLPELSGSVADIGCGAQPYRPLVPSRATYIGIDTEDAARNFGYDLSDVRRLDGDRWPLDDNEVDTVLSTETLEHVPEPERFLAEAARCLRSGGKVVLTVPFAARWHYVPHDYWRFTPSSLRRLLEAAGFSGVTIWARGNAFTVACYKVMALLLPIALPQRRAGTVRVSVWALLLGFPILLLALLGHLSLRSSGGEDCLGYTVVATRNDA
jgi:SAM-dependent methyltransferase